MKGQIDLTALHERELAVNELPHHIGERVHKFIRAEETWEDKGTDQYVVISEARVSGESVEIILENVETKKRSWILFPHPAARTHLYVRKDG